MRFRIHSVADRGLQVKQGASIVIHMRLHFFALLWCDAGCSLLIVWHLQNENGSKQQRSWEFNFNFSEWSTFSLVSFFGSSSTTAAIVYTRQTSQHSSSVRRVEKFIMKSSQDFLGGDDRVTRLVHMKQPMNGLEFEVFFSIFSAQQLAALQYALCTLNDVCSTRTIESENLLNINPCDRIRLKFKFDIFIDTHCSATQQQQQLNSAKTTSEMN